MVKSRMERSREILFTKVILITESGILQSKSKKEATFLIEMAPQRLPLSCVITITIQYNNKCFQTFKKDETTFEFATCVL